MAVDLARPPASAPSELRRAKSARAPSRRSSRRNRYASQSTTRLGLDSNQQPSKILSVARYWLTVGVDLYNALNDAGVTGIRTGFGTTAAPASNWLNPTGIVGPRQVRLSGTFDF